MTTPAKGSRVPTRLAQAVLALGLVAALVVTFTRGSSERARQVPYSELVDAVRGDRVETAEVRPGKVAVHLKAVPEKAAETLVAERIPSLDASKLVDLLEAHHVVVSGKLETDAWWSAVLWNVLPFVALPLLFWWGSRGMARKNQPLSFGRSKAKIYDKSAETPVTFADVAGVEEAKAELVEIVKFLKEPGRYRDMGARVPKGVLLVGAPGTGKTLLAKAVAGESGVPFFSMSGSEFVEMFVGVGASRVRDLFIQAKERAPCIIFVDELDAVGKARAGAVGFAANEEREQTLNQLLVEMDGFDSSVGLVLLAATNRPEILDRALLRAGRFDRQVLVDRPDLRGREAILRVHARKVRLASDVDLVAVARRTPGMVGADLANVVNEAALAAVRREATIVGAEDLEEAVDRIQLGLRKEGRVMTEGEKRRVAVHEAGHALVALSMKHSDPVDRVTIIPRSIGALGATLQLPTEERYLLTGEELRDRLCVLLGGRAAEQIVLHDVSTGAEDDLRRATEIARQMVCRFGMSDAIGPMAISRRGAGRFPLALEPDEGQPTSEHTAELVDAETKALLVREDHRARQALEGRRTALDAIARELVARETLHRAELEDLVRSPPPAAPVLVTSAVAN